MEAAAYVFARNHDSSYQKSHVPYFQNVQNSYEAPSTTNPCQGLVSTVHPGNLHTAANLINASKFDEQNLSTRDGILRYVFQYTYGN